jgi:hypothetical protein
MKKIFLIGDSIRMGYDKYVKEALSGVAEVYYPDENGRFAEYVLRYAPAWKTKLELGEDIDFVHWNAGLWDVLEMHGDEPLTTPDYYANAVFRIHKKLRLLFPNAKIVFATTTAVNEAKMSADFKRRNSVIEDYNKRAIDALANTDAIINDMYSLTKGCSDECRSDGVHFATPEGISLTGKRVISVICHELGIAASDVNIENFQPENYSKENIGM